MLFYASFNVQLINYQVCVASLLPDCHISGPELWVSDDGEREVMSSCSFYSQPSPTIRLAVYYPNQYNRDHLSERVFIIRTRVISVTLF